MQADIKGKLESSYLSIKVICDLRATGTNRHKLNNLLSNLVEAIYIENEEIFNDIIIKINKTLYKDSTHRISKMV